MKPAARYSRAELTEAVNDLDMQIPSMPTGRLFRLALEHYNTRKPRKKASLDSDDAFLLRISVNYLRHQVSEYDLIRDFLRRSAADHDHVFVGAIVKGRTLRAIAATYPMLRGEALSQAKKEDLKVRAALSNGRAPHRGGTYARSNSRSATTTRRRR